MAEKIFPTKRIEFKEGKIEKINASLIEKRKGIDQAQLVFGYHMPSLLDKKRYAAEILDVILGKGMASRLFQEIREKRGLAYAVKGMLEQDKNYGYEMIYIGTVKEKINEIKELILKEIKKMQNLEKKDFEQAKEQLHGLNALATESSADVMRVLIQEENAGNAEEYYKYDERIEKVKLEDVRKLARLGGYSFVALVPD